MSTYSFDAASLLGLGTPSTDPLPQPEPGWVVLHIPDGLTLQSLRDSPVGQKLMHNQDWYNKYPWSNTALPVGVYCLRVPVPDSNRKTASEQDKMLPAGETSAPVVLVATALLCVRLQGGPDPLQNDWTRCLEQAAGGGRVVLHWCGGRLIVDDYWDDYRSGLVWASSLRTS